MSERRISGWFVLSAVFIVAVFGLFFTFTERKTWPEQRTELAAADMRLVPPSSTLWCEAVALTSHHPFVAYQVSLPPLIEPKHLNKQRVNLNLKLNGGQSGNSMKLRYFLLPASVIEIFACATHPGARILVFKGDQEVTSCLQQPCGEDSDESESEEEDEEEEGDSPTDSPKCGDPHCPSLVSNQVISSSDVREESSYTCEDVRDVRPVHVNITSADFYVIVVLNTNRHRSNAVGLRIVLDRSRYTIHKSGNTFDMCSLSSACTIGLSFASSDRALVWIPDEPNAGKATYVIRSQCKPRLAVFAILSVFFPLIVFLGVAFVVRADRDRLMRLYRCGGDPRDRQQRSDSRFAAPLLDDMVAGSGDFTHFHTREAPQTPTDEQPPPYHTLYDPPPPYACVKQEESNK